jgi:hypothetical protein
MAFILSGDGRDEDVVGAFRRYQDYLQSSKDRFPPSACALATSGWYFDAADHRCPHDAWLEALELSESATGNRREKRSLSMKVRLLGAYHDGHIELRYPRVLGYTLDIKDGEHGHRDWRYDELRVSDQGTLIHEIEWCGLRDTGTWTIEASDVEFRWVPDGGDEPAQS